MEMKSYILADAVDGRTIHLIRRVSSRKLARQHARQFARSYTDDFDLIELRNGGERWHVQRYTGQARERGPFVKL